MEVLSSAVCRSCRSQVSSINSARSFSTTIQRRIIPPESPAFIDVPASFQPNSLAPRREKGILPVPRELFPASRPDKPSQQYLDNLTKSPLPENEVAYDSLSELGKYRYRMAELRKRHIREGLTELHKRKVDTIAKIENRSRTRKIERQRLVTQAPREDARLTNNSVPQSLRPTKSSTPIADDLAAAKALYERKLANHQSVTQAKSEERLDALHTLYMNARAFITTEKQLTKAIEEQFDNEYLFQSDAGPGKSMWNKGPPDTIQKMIANNQVKETGGLEIVRSASSAVRLRLRRDQERMQKIAETLSGGKM